jgi:phage terminase large subunit-like protein
MRAGPKAAVDGSRLPFRSPKVGAERFAAFCRSYIVVPKGHGARRRLRLRPWQVELVASVLDATPRPRLAGWMLPRGAGKTSLVAAMALYDLLLGDEGASIVVAATDERQAGLCFGVAARMVELHDDLAARVQVFQDKLVVPGRGASFQVLPAVPKRLEGLDFTWPSWMSSAAWSGRCTRWWLAPAASGLPPRPSASARRPRTRPSRC